MVAIKIATFGGMLPAVDEHLLPDTAAVYAENSFLYSGALRPIPKSKVLHTLTNTGSGYVYRIPKTYEDADYLYESFWMEFPSPNTNVLRSNVINDVHDRYYIFSDAAPPKYNTKARIVAGQPAWLLGIPAPLVAPSVVVSGGIDVTHTRAYTYTYVSEYGEEGPPAPPYVVTPASKIDATHDVTVTAPAVADQGPAGPNRNITKWRLYRTVTSTSGVATFYFVVEQPLSDLTYSDVLKDSVIAINDEIGSTFFTGPPANLVGAVMMPNGMVAGWTATQSDTTSGDDVWFCEPYRMHAWPGKYQQSVEYPIVGLGVLGQTCVICTSGYPSTATGTSPGFISMAQLTVFEPCLSRGSILSTPEGVYYASPGGLQLIGSGSIENITRQAATKDKWQKLTVLSSLRAARVGTAYYAWGSARLGVFDESAFEPLSPFPFEQTDLTGSLVGILIDPAVPSAGIIQLRSETPIINVETDPWSGELFIIKEGKVFWLDLTNIDDPLEVSIWYSKIFQTNQVRNFGALKLYFDLLPGTPSGNYGRVKVIADGTIVAMDREIVKTGQLMRPHSGWKANFWQIQLTSQVKIKSVQMGSSVKELNTV